MEVVDDFRLRVKVIPARDNQPTAVINKPASELVFGSCVSLFVLPTNTLLATGVATGVSTCASSITLTAILLSNPLASFKSNVSTLPFSLDWSALSAFGSSTGLASAFGSSTGLASAFGSSTGLASARLSIFLYLVLQQFVELKTFLLEL